MTRRQACGQGDGTDRQGVRARMSEALDRALTAAEEHLLQGTEPEVPQEIRDACDAMFRSHTQAHREVAVGCLLTRIYEPNRNIRLPYVKQGPDAFSGRSLDEGLVNPFLQRNSIPSSKGPYLSVFRRQVTFDESEMMRFKDPDAFRGLLELIAAAELEDNRDALLAWLMYLMYRFAQLREDAEIALQQLARISLEQYERILGGLLSEASGGYFAVAIIVAAVQTMIDRFSLQWTVDYQEINVADAVRGAGGDITVRVNGVTVMVIEVTQREVDEARLVDTFRSKIAQTQGDYVFMVHLESIRPEVRELAERYFAQGHEVNFVDIREWTRSILVAVGHEGRSVFQDRLITLLSQPDVPGPLKVAWNEQIDRAVRVGG